MVIPGMPATLSLRMAVTGSVPASTIREIAWSSANTESWPNLAARDRVPLALCGSRGSGILNGRGQSSLATRREPRPLGAGLGPPRGGRRTGGARLYDCRLQQGCRGTPCAAAPSTRDVHDSAALGPPGDGRRRECVRPGAAQRTRAGIAVSRTRYSPRVVAIPGNRGGSISRIPSGFSCLHRSAGRTRGAETSHCRGAWQEAWFDRLRVRNLFVCPHAEAPLGHRSGTRATDPISRSRPGYRNRYPCLGLHRWPKHRRYVRSADQQRVTPGAAHCAARRDQRLTPPVHAYKRVSLPLRSSARLSRTERRGARWATLPPPIRGAEVARRRAAKVDRRGGHGRPRRRAT